MASINEEGNVKARCPGCDGALSTFVWRDHNGPFGVTAKLQPKNEAWGTEHRLFRCGGCARGALGIVIFNSGHLGKFAYPGSTPILQEFYPEVTEKLELPNEVPSGIRSEFREAEACMDARCFRAAAGLFRSVLDKTLRANGYKLKNGTTLEQQIDLAAKDGVITAARARRAHEDIRVLGNDVLHDDWHEVSLSDVEVARRYAQRILEDFYDDRDTVLEDLCLAGRLPREVKPNGASDSSEPSQPPT